MRGTDDSSSRRHAMPPETKRPAYGVLERRLGGLGVMWPSECFYLRSRKRKRPALNHLHLHLLTAVSLSVNLVTSQAYSYQFPVRSLDCQRISQLDAEREIFWNHLIPFLFLLLPSGIWSCSCSHLVSSDSGNWLHHRGCWRLWTNVI